MPQWIKWTGISRDGKKHTGIIEKAHTKALQTYLNQNGILVKKWNRTFLQRITAHKISKMKLLNFYQQLAILTQANLSLAQSLGILYREQRSGPIKLLLGQINQDVESGLSFASALKKQDDYFDKSIPLLVESALQAGQLPKMLEHLAYTLERQERLRQNLRKALRYPAFVFITAMMVIFGLLQSVIPQFQSLFHSVDRELPFFTQWLISSALFIKTKSFFLCLTSIFLGAGFFFLKKHTTFLAFLWDKSLLKNPIFGTLNQNTLIAQFASSLHLCLSAGVPIPDALKAVSEISQNLFFIQGVKGLQLAVAQGQALHSAMRQVGLFPSFVLELVATCEATGKIHQAFAEIAAIFEKRLDAQLDSLKDLLEPCILLILGLIIGFIVIALYLPIFTLGTLL